MADNFTIWQRLTKVFGPDSTLGQQPPVYKFDKKELLKTTDKQEFEKEKLQAQQTMYLGQQWGKVENNLYSQAIYYEPTRLASYYDYESMEYTPEISAALDIYAEESTTTNEDGYILQIYSESNRIKGILADLFNNKTSTSKKESLSCESLLYSPLLSSNSNNNLSYLLNMFDGINECSGRIIIMTSNKPEVLDKALIRPGRIDIKLNFQKCTRYDAMCLINLFWNTHFQEEQLLPDIDMKYTSADIYSIFRSTNDFEDISGLFILPL